MLQKLFMVKRQKSRFLDLMENGLFYQNPD